MLMKRLNRWLFTAVFLASGLFHFLNPGLYIRLMPDWVPYPGPAVLVSGFFEIAGGVGLIIPRFRRVAVLVLIVLLMIFLVVHLHPLGNEGEIMRGLVLPMWVIWARIVFQFMMMAGLYWISLPDPVAKATGPTASVGSANS